VFLIKIMWNKSKAASPLRCCYLQLLVSNTITTISATFAQPGASSHQKPNRVAT
jgi:hypothetical protein